MKLNARVYGEGTPLIVLHGLFGMSDNWNSLGKKWAEEHGFQVHLLDQRNHGQSEWADPHTYEAMSADLFEYMDENKLDKAHILGHSMGGKTAMFFSVFHDDRVNKLIVADIGPKAYPVHHADIIEALQYLLEEPIKDRKEGEERLAKKIKHQGVRQFLLKNLHRKKDETYDMRFNLKLLAEQIENVGEPLPDGAIFGGSALFIRGGKSDYIKDEDSALIEKHFPLASLKTIKDAGHWLHAERPEEFSGMVLDFLL